ncbi:MAG: substrate-binding domain-containing protein [Anaerolineales bacterium]
MDKTFLYQRIAEAIRQDILHGRFKLGDRLPSVREMTQQWGCTPGTVQHAYRELADQGLVSAHPGRGTHVAGGLSLERETPARRANLVHRAEAFLLEALAGGFAPVEVEQALRLALDRWRTLMVEPVKTPAGVLRFAGSHDPAIAWVAAHYPEIRPGYIIELTFTGSRGGLIALAEAKADLAGCHLWDEESDTYNAPFVQRFLPGQQVALLTLAHRLVGLIVSPGNPAALANLEDLARPGLRFVNRQHGSGTRVWLDAQLRRAAIDPERISGYAEEKPTHSEVARAVAESHADVGVGVAAAALSFGLDFVPLTTERYDLIIPAEKWELPPIQALVAWLSTTRAKSTIANLGGYDTAGTGTVNWI